MKSRNILIGGSLVVVAVAAVAIWGVYDPGNDQTEGPAETVVHPATFPSMVTYIDPETGELVSAPASGQAPELGDAVNTSDEGLELQPSPVPGGGVMIDLQGRYQNTVIVTGDSDSVKVRCVPDSQAVKAAEGGDER